MSKEENNDANLAQLPGHAVRMRLFDADDQSVLYVNSFPQGHQLTCEITNISERDIVIDAIQGEPSEDLYHFAIRFRRGVFDPNTTGDFNLNGMVQEGWQVSAPIPSADGLTLYFLHTGSGEKILKGKSINIGLGNTQASVRAGARTTRAELKFNNLRYEGENERILWGIRLHLLNIINHLGHRNSPLRVEWVTPHQVLNNGTAQTLELQIINTSQDETLDFDGKTAFVFSFHTNSNDPSQKLVNDPKNINFYLKNPTENDNSVGFGASAEERVLNTAVEGMVTKLLPKEVISIWIRLNTTEPAGVANLMVRQENLVGYWDHTFVLPIVKSPLVLENTHVGIGKISPQLTLDVKNGGTIGTSHLVNNNHHNKDNIGNKINVGYHPAHPKKEEADLLFSGMQIKVEESTDQKGNRTTIGFNTWENNVSYSREVMQVNGNGNVGIGTSNPTHKLDVTGDINVSGKVKENGNDLLPKGSIIMWSGAEVPAGWVLCDGKNDTPNLVDRFIMGGKAQKFDDKDTKRVSGNNKMTLERKHLPDHTHEMRFNIHPAATGNKVRTWTLWQSAIGNKTSDRDFYTKGINGGNGANPASFDNRPAYYTLAFIMKK